ncbi:competence/damage-inducible protein A [Cognatazoarcus halotolerans]|uniref:competence/damage-inducible protein A n=1 Tax=Cognatazoarcus halotolerans TaxID=2686016 RepID=UPI00135CA883|nr:molybdopterin-binding protein [Cognatazoarcus halotolerans]MCB1900544.1 competence/damage-inducible protein A [Rhodocyclaceae bacterium]MCP5311045.1 competence/damage-inducible protein A [Zoogloeaceae bacterium]
MAFGAIIIGDEILSGRREDKHRSKLTEMLLARGLKLSWVRYVGDEPPRLIQTLKESFATGDIVFSFGGIGATPDDHTRQCCGAALGLAMALHPDAEREIRLRFGDETTAHRLQMGVYPVGSEIIPNPYNQIPGFSIRQHFFVPGFPVMAWPMVEWVLDTRFAHLHHQEDYVEQAITVWDAYEGKLIQLMEAITADFPDATLFSLPTIAGEGGRRSVELGMKGPQERVSAAMTRIKREVGALGYEWQDKP